MISSILMHKKQIEYPACKVLTARHVTFKYLANRVFKDRLVSIREVDLVNGEECNPRTALTYQAPYEDINAFIAQAHGVLRNIKLEHTHDITIVGEQYGWVQTFNNLEELMQFIYAYKPDGIVYDFNPIGYDLVFTGDFASDKTSVCSSGAQPD